MKGETGVYTRFKCVNTVYYIPLINVSTGTVIVEKLCPITKADVFKMFTILSE